MGKKKDIYVIEINAVKDNGVTAYCLSCGYDGTMLKFDPVHNLSELDSLVKDVANGNSCDIRVTFTEVQRIRRQNEETEIKKRLEKLL